MTKDPVMRCGGAQNCHELNHLRQIVAHRDLGRVKELVKGAQYYCKNCGRAARDEANLCNPSKL